MCYIRGQASDYDRWAKLTGSEKFSYENVLPYFKKSQTAHGYGDPEYNGTEGEINVEKNHMDKLLYGELCEVGIYWPSDDNKNGNIGHGLLLHATCQPQWSVRSKFKAFVKAGGEAGFPIIDDPNGPSQEGFGIYPTFSYQGVRQRKVLLG